MKAIRLFFLILLSVSFSFLIYSCKSDDTVTSGVSPDAAYSWSSQTLPYDTVGQIFYFENDNAIVYADGIKKISGGTVTPITVNDTSFNYQGFLPYSADYYVFSGNKISDDHTPVIKIYDNGVYRDYYMPRQSSLAIAFTSYFIAKDKFYIILYPESNRYFLFDNGTFTEFMLSGGNIINFFKTDNNIYARAYAISPSGFSYHKITSTGPSYLWSETFPSMTYSSEYFLSNDLINITTDSLKLKFSCFTEQGWKYMFTYNASNTHEYFQCLSGESRNQFLALKLNTDTRITEGYVWDGSNFTQQTNIPEGIKSQMPYAYLTQSNYKNKSFLLYPNYNSRILYKAVYRGL